MPHMCPRGLKPQEEVKKPTALPDCHQGGRGLKSREKGESLGRSQKDAPVLHNGRLKDTAV